MNAIKRTFSLILVAVLILAGLMTPLEAQAATTHSTAGVVTTSGGRLNVRSGASTSAYAVSSLGKGSYVTLISKSGSW